MFRNEQFQDFVLDTRSTAFFIISFEGFRFRTISLHEVMISDHWDQTSLPANEEGSRRRLDNLIKRLKSSDRYDDYDETITKQMKDGVIEHAPSEASDKEFYIPHRAVVKGSAESAKLRIAYEASARESRTSPSLNDCLNPGPCLQNRPWSILVWSRFFLILLTGDLEKAFLQVIENQRSWTWSTQVSLEEAWEQGCSRISFYEGVVWPREFSLLT